MRAPVILASLAATLIVTLPSRELMVLQTAGRASAVESRVPVAGASLYARTIGNGQPILVLHGGPDFDSAYFRPDLDRLADAYRLIYYDQRARGKSAEHVRGEDVTLASDIDDLDKVRQHFGLESATLLGHSWGAVLAMEYALRNPTRVSRLILMNPATASAADLAVFRKVYVDKLGDAAMSQQRQIVAGRAYQEGDPDAVAARYRIHFRPAFAHAEDFERLMKTMKAAFVAQGKDGIVKARVAEDRLMHDTWEVPGYDLLPKLETLRVPTLGIAADHDFFPIETAAHIAQAIPGATLVTLQDCGHFSYMECPGDVHKVFDDFFSRR